MGAVVELTDEEWGLVEALFDPPVHRGVKGTIPRRDIVDAILWVARTGCQWRYLPARFPDWQAVWSQWRRWRDKGTWAAAMRVLAREIRLRCNRKADPTMVMIDGQTVKGGRAGPTFHEAGGRGGYTRGAKRTILIEILGLPLAVSVESAKREPTQRHAYGHGSDDQDSELCDVDQRHERSLGRGSCAVSTNLRNDVSAGRNAQFTATATPGGTRTV